MSAARLVVRLPRIGVSARIDVRLVLACAGLTAFGLVCFLANLAYGEFPLPIGDVLATLAGGGLQADRFIVVDLRLPRALVAALVGAALGLSGTLFQMVARNPLASPDIIGILAGASLAGVTAFAIGASTAIIAPVAFAGALVAAALLYVLAWRGGLSPYRLVLIGIGIYAIATAGISYTLVRGRIEDVQQAAVWLVGSLNGRTWDEVWLLALGLAVLVPVAAALARSLDALSLGDEAARALGVPVERTRLALVVCGAALAGIAVAAAGPVAFAALLAPQIARRLARTPGAAVLPAAALSGAALVLAADLVGRLLFAPTELPVGIVTATLGAPFFLYLLYRSNRVFA